MKIYLERATVESLIMAAREAAEGRRAEAEEHPDSEAMAADYDSAVEAAGLAIQDADSGPHVRAVPVHHPDGDSGILIHYWRGMFATGPGRVFADVKAADGRLLLFHSRADALETAAECRRNQGPD